MTTIKILSDSERQTKIIGFKIGNYLKNRGSGLVLLYGELACGKTVLAKGIGSAIGIKERDIGSSSFVIISEYETIPRFYHIDLYRLEDDKSVDETGIWDIINFQNIVVVEWAERLKNIDVEDTIIKLEINCTQTNTREIIIEGINEKDWNYM